MLPQQVGSTQVKLPNVNIPSEGCKSVTMIDITYICVRARFAACLGYDHAVVGGQFLDHKVFGVAKCWGSEAVNTGRWMVG